MKKILYIVLAIISLSFNVKAQLPYALTVYTNTYTALTGSTNINGSTVWDYYYNFSAPTGFDYKMDTFTVHQFNFTGMEHMWTDTARTMSYHPNMSYLGFTDAAFIDKGYGTSTSLSPISYSVTGAVGHRIFKMQISNAGFALEKLNHGTLNDFIDVQFWVYEDSSILEIHYGPSLISYTDYFLHGTGPMVWYALDWPWSDDGDGYVLQGSPSAPTIKRFPFTGGGAPFSVTTLNAWPGNGTVYRFGPGITGVPKNELLQKSLTVRPNPIKDRGMISFYNPANSLYKLGVYNSIGQMVLEKQNITGTTVSIDRSGLQSGVYYFRLIGETNFATGKMTIE